MLNINLTQNIQIIQWHYIINLIFPDVKITQFIDK